MQATDIVQIKSRKVLEPLVDVLLDRTAYIFKRLFGVAVQIMREDTRSEYGMLGIYELFLAELQRVFSGMHVETIEPPAH